MASGEKLKVSAHFLDREFLTGIYDVFYDWFDIREDAANPDFVVHSVFGRRHWDYDCTRICFSGENVTPDFNISDYGIACDRLTFGDRYLRFPFYLTRVKPEHNPAMYREEAAGKAAAKTKFCNFIYSNGGSGSDPIRREFFYLLSEYKHVDSGGRYLNNIGGPLMGDDNDKVNWQRDFKFSIAFENSVKPGYVTEKLYDALAADTIPIYWGDPLVATEFNGKRFIHCRDYPSLEAVVARVRELDNDPALYAETLAQPWYMGEPPPAFGENGTLRNFLTHIFEQGPELSRRVPRRGWSRNYVKRLREAEHKSVPARMWMSVRKSVHGGFRKIFPKK